MTKFPAGKNLFEQAGGACGYCETEVLELEGELDHRDDWLSEEDKLSQRKFMPCVSRATCSRLVVDL